MISNNKVSYEVVIIEADKFDGYIRYFKNRAYISSIGVTLNREEKASLQGAKFCFLFEGEQIQIPASFRGYSPYDDPDGSYEEGSPLTEIDIFKQPLANIGDRVRLPAVALFEAANLTMDDGYKLGQDLADFCDPMAVLTTGEVLAKGVGKNYITYITSSYHGDFSRYDIVYSGDCLQELVMRARSKTKSSMNKSKDLNKTGLDTPKEMDHSPEKTRIGLTGQPLEDDLKEDLEDDEDEDF